MSGPIEESYFNWLCAKVTSPHNNNHYDLLRILHTTEFVWSVPGDRHRLEDGLELRQYFLNETRWVKDPLWYNELCSIFEVLIAFATRASFQTDTPVSDWFWIFLNNLNLDEYRQVSDSDACVIEDVLYTFIWRTYDSHGYGGLFPLDNPKEDQRAVEVWYQFCAYVDEKELI